MSHPTTIERPVQITIAPMVQLVDIHGDPVPDCERHTPVCDPDPTDPADWGPGWDNFHWQLGPEPGPDDEGPGDDDFDDIDRADVDAADAALADLEYARLAPISGGSPDHEYTDEDHASHMAWLQELDGSFPPADRAEEQRAWYRRNPIESFNRLRTD